MSQNYYTPVPSDFNTQPGTEASLPPKARFSFWGSGPSHFHKCLCHPTPPFPSNGNLQSWPKSSPFHHHHGPAGTEDAGRCPRRQRITPRKPRCILAVRCHCHLQFLDQQPTYVLNGLLGSHTYDQQQKGTERRPFHHPPAAASWTWRPARAPSLAQKAASLQARWKQQGQQRCLTAPPSVPMSNLIQRWLAGPVTGLG